MSLRQKKATRKEHFTQESLPLLANFFAARMDDICAEFSAGLLDHPEAFDLLRAAYFAGLQDGATPLARWYEKLESAT